MMDVSTQGDVTLVRPAGRLDSANAPDLERQLTERLDQGAQRLLFDFSTLDYISSAGLRVVLLAGKRLRASQGKLVLVGLGELVREVFEMSGFLTLFEVHATVDEGLAALAT